MQGNRLHLMNSFDQLNEMIYLIEAESGVARRVVTTGESVVEVKAIVVELLHLTILLELARVVLCFCCC